MNKSLAILYGSQTGNAQDIGETIERSMKHITSIICPMDNYELKHLQFQSMILFICSTTGDGEEPDNMKKFLRFLMRKDLKQSLLTHLEYGIIGLGDSTYSKFNFSAKILHRRLLSLGGKSILEPCLADESHPLGTFHYVQSWIQRFYNIIKIKWGLRTEFSLDPTNRPSFFAYKIRWVENSNKCETFWENEGYSTSHVVKTKRVTSNDHFQDVRLMTLSHTVLSSSRSAGDVVLIWPENPPKIVSNFLNLLGRQENECFQIVEANEIKFAVGAILTVGNVLKYYLDINGVPRRSFFSRFLQFATDQLERSRLAEFISNEGLDDLYDYSTRPRRNYYEVMRDFPKTTSALPFDYILELIPRLGPREYSIASGSNELVEILYVVVNYKMVDCLVPRIGTCSTWLSTLNDGDMVPIKLKKSGMKFGLHNVLVGPGTGIGAFRSYLKSHECKNENLLFFGCRNRTRDFYFEREWPSYYNLHFFVAFSRDQKDKQYVQHLIEANSLLVAQFLTDLQANVIISGNAKHMPKSVREALVHSLINHRSMSFEDADLFLKRMERSKRYQTHVWV